jgi:hypothetical protein
VRARTDAAGQLQQFLLDGITRAPAARHVVVAHSHGANIVLHALHGGHPRVRKSLSAVVLLSPPLLNCTSVEDPTAAANKLLLGAITVVPLFFLAAKYATAIFGLSRIATLLAAIVLTMLWLRLFWPSLVQRRAERLVEQLGLPPLDLPGLVVRTPGDEAHAALSSVGAFASLARHVWSWVVRLRPPYRAYADEELRGARDGGALIYALCVVFGFSYLSVRWLSRARDAVEGGDWTAIAVVPLALSVTIPPLVIVGGAVLLLLLLPACSFLLWPFGIFPSTAAALLTVSVAEAPTPRWTVKHVPGDTRPGWKHSTHRNATALETVAAYLRDELTGVDRLDLHVAATLQTLPRSVRPCHTKMA